MATVALVPSQDWFQSFLADEGHAPTPKWLAKYALVLLILNEIRGASVVASVVWAYFGRG